VRGRDACSSSVVVLRDAFDFRFFFQRDARHARPLVAALSGFRYAIFSAAFDFSSCRDARAMLSRPPLFAHRRR
jgi:hypothetical protein